MPIGCALRYTATHTCPRAGGASSLPDALLHLFAPALVQPRPARTGGKRFFTGRKKRHITPVVSCAERAYLCQPKPEDGTKQAAEAQSRHGARAWRLRALPDRRRSRAHRAARLEGHLAVARQDCWRGLQHAAPQRQGALCAGRLAGRLRELDGAPARGEPRARAGHRGAGAEPVRRRSWQARPARQWRAAQHCARAVAVQRAAGDGGLHDPERRAGRAAHVPRDHQAQLPRRFDEHQLGRRLPDARQRQPTRGGRRDARGSAGGGI